MIKFNPKTNKIEGKVKSFNDEGRIEINSDFHLYKSEEDLKALQVSIYVMCGGGMLGRFAMSQPADFYIDDRVGKLPYSKSDIYQVVEVMKAICHHLGKDAHHLPEINFPGCWVF